MEEYGYFYGICKNYPENGQHLDVFEKCCSMRLRSAIKTNQYSFVTLVEIIHIYKFKNHKGQFCLEEELLGGRLIVVVETSCVDGRRVV